MLLVVPHAHTNIPLATAIVVPQERKFCAPWQIGRGGVCMPDPVPLSQFYLCTPPPLVAG